MKLKKVVLLISAVMLAAAVILNAVQHQGDLFLISPAAPVSIETTPPSTGASSSEYCSSVGGVGFEKSAEPEEGLNVESLNMLYDADKPDGERLLLHLNGEPISTPVYDWQFIPAVHFAHSDSFSVFTLFGDLYDVAFENLVLENEGRILNYHPFVQNTLMGLRLYQLDVLILWAESALLPKEDGEYILGAGEAVPDTVENYEALVAFYHYWENLVNELGVQQRSWIISDFRSEILFSVDAGKLTITGDPYYYMWRFKNDRHDFSEQQALAEADALLQAMYSDWQGQNPGKTYRQWVIEACTAALREYEENYPKIWLGTIEELLLLPTDDERAAQLNRYGTGDLYEGLLITLYYTFDAYQVEPLWEYSDRISAQTDMLRNINPAVWNASATFMRYAAFFRYCRENFPEQWRAFLMTLGHPPLQPQLTTPTALYNKSKSDVTQYLQGQPAQGPDIIGLPDVALYDGGDCQLALDQYVTDMDSRPQNLEWIATHIGPSSSQAMTPVIMNYVDENRLPQKQMRLNSNVQRAQLSIFQSETGFRNSGLAAAAGLTVEIDPVSHVARFSANDNSQSCAYDVIFKVTDETGLSDVDTVRVGVIVDVETNEQPASFSLLSVYPNPFNGSASLCFYLPVSSHLFGEVYNMVGQKVGTVVDQNFSAGEHTLSWKVDKNFAAGVYWILLSAATGQGSPQKILEKVVYVK